MLYLNKVQLECTNMAHSCTFNSTRL